MKATLQALCLVLAATIGWAGQAHAVPITIHFTADNTIDDGGLCSDMACTGATASWTDLGAVNLSDWRTSDSVTLDLGPGTYYFAWQLTNVGTPGPFNPAGLLAEILWQGNTSYSNASSNGWDVSTDGGASWMDATAFGVNGGPNIWTNVNGGLVAGIGTGAEWLWTGYNGDPEMNNDAWLRTYITVKSVPEPSTLALLGLGLLGMGAARRRRTA